MLILMQKPGSRAVITLPDGTKMYVMVIAIERNRVRLGYEVPRHIVVDREVIHDRKMRGEPRPPKPEPNGNVAEEGGADPA